MFRSRISRAVPVSAAIIGVTTLSPAITATADTTRLQEDVNAIRASGQTGVQARVDSPAGSAHARSGVADIRTGRPVPRNGHLRIGSVTKSFTAVVVLQLAAEGRLKLDDTVEELLPGVVQGNGNDGSKVTLRQLLQQTSGLYDYLRDLPLTEQFYYDHRFDTADPAKLVANAMKHEPSFPSGTRWSYSNTNYLIAGMIIKKVTGNGWDQEVRDRIIRPLGLRNTSIPGARPYLPRPHARGYRAFEDGGRLVETTLMNPTVADAAGAMVSTPADLNRFWRSLFAGDLLPPAQLKEMRTTVPAKEWHDDWPEAKYGLGISWKKLPCGGFWGHDGDFMGWATRTGISPDGKRGFTISVSSEAGDDDAMNKAHLRLATNALCTKENRARN